MEEAEQTHLPGQLRELFVTLLLFCNVGDPPQLFEDHHQFWWDDFALRLQSSYRVQDEQLLRAMVLIDIEIRLVVF